MADTQNQILVEDFTNQLQLATQQETSMFRGKILEAPVTGRLFEHQLLGGDEADEINSRFQKIEFGNPDHQRRGALIKGFQKAYPIDNDDQLKAMVDMKSGYAKAMSALMMRALDREIASAALGNILTGEQFTTTVDAATDGVQTVTAGAGLNYDKVNEGIQVLNSTGAGLSGEKVYLAITDVQAKSLREEIEVISNDYGNVDSARTGGLPMIGGATPIVFPSAPQTGSSIINLDGSDRECFLFTEDALKLGMLSDFEVRYERRTDLVDTHQLVVTSRYAALRTEGAKIVKFDVAE